MSRNPSDLIDVGAEVAPLGDYWFLGVAGAVTATGIIVDMHGARVDGSLGFTATIPAASAGVTDGVDVATLLGLTAQTLYTSFPNAAGIILNLSGNVYVDIHLGTAPADFKANPSRYPVINSGNGIKLGRVV